MKDKFNQVYAEIISEGFFRNLKQVFKTNKSNLKEFGEMRTRLFTHNGFEATDKTNREWVNNEENITIKFAPLKDNNGKFRFEIPARITLEKIKTKFIAKISDTEDELAKKIEKALVDAGSTFEFVSSKEIKNQESEAEHDADVDRED